MKTMTCGVTLHTRIAEVVQQMWKENLGINIRLENMEWKVYQARREEKRFDIARAEWVADYVDPRSFLDVWLISRYMNDL